ncbi:hypothetical protein ITJ54_01000 [Curtobacterium sp. VKM Ac-2865]|uniref:FHA domain-containing protein n=1 Tax=Curtobacterium sp. VKM Ac-2865 TaxID=2783817 RepID=UPI00188C87A2|nr:FHA domain-containing protein [Curtobacterium sp. VKM Ac-2865]MBF4581240.1 hypothetical protein [Curtobacterium sp. VKM Ac-2865]
MHDDGDDIEDTVLRPRHRAVGRDRASDAVEDTVIRVPRDGSRVGSAPGREDGVTSAPEDVAAPDPEDLAAPDPEDTVVRARGARASAQVTGLPEVPPSLPDVVEPPRARVPSIRVADRVIRLDRPVVVGRRPALPRVVRGPEPELVVVRSPSGQVSSSHVAFHAEGEAAVVDDLHSTNGTVVRPAGAAAYRMPSGASIVALTGTVVEIGDGIGIEVLSPHLRVTPPADDFPTSPPPRRTTR